MSSQSDAKVDAALIAVAMTFCLTLHPYSIGAEEGPHPTIDATARPAPVMPALPILGNLTSNTIGLRLYGYLDGSYTQNFNNPSSKINPLRIFDVNANQFRPNLAQLVLEREAKTTGSGIDRAGFRVKFNAGRDSDFIGGTNLSPWADFQEFYFQYIAPVGTGLTVLLGQFNALIGYEAIESPHNANYSRSWLFGLGQPFTTRGLRMSSAFNDRVSLSVGVIGYINSARADTQNDSLAESALVVHLLPRITLTLYGLVGPRSGPTGTPGGKLLLGGGFVNWRASDRMSIILESYYANQTHSSTISQAGNARWDGVAGYLLYDFTNQWSLHLRSELYEDAGGLTTCQGDTSYQPRANVCFGASSTAPATPVAQTLWEVTSTLQFKPIPSLITRIEYRYDKSNENVFQVGGRATSYQPTLSFEVIYLF